MVPLMTQDNVDEVNRYLSGLEKKVDAKGKQREEKKGQ